jgi:hypothetical protein
MSGISKSFKLPTLNLAKGPFIICDWGWAGKKKGVGHEVFLTEKGGAT